MKTLKYIFVFFLLTAIGKMANAQKVWIDPEEPDVTAPVRLYVDLEKMDNTSLLNLDGPFYIWTWSPIELGANSPKVNGTGDKPWKSSSDILKMTKDESKGPKVWYYEMIPTEFYEVPASEVYAKGIKFLVKPKDGGGYGEPDLKTEDLSLTITAPKTERGVIYQFPTVILEHELVNMVYNNPADTANPGMKNLGAEDAYMWMKMTAVDTVSNTTVTYQPSSFFLAGNNESLKMTKDESTGMFSITFIPHEFFGLKPSEKCKEIEVTVRKKVYSSAADRTSDQPKFKVGCK